MENIVKGDGSEYLDFEEIYPVAKTSPIAQKTTDLYIVFVDIEMNDRGRRTCVDIAGNWIFIFLIIFFVKYSTFAAPELFTFDIIE
jgi:hypothetical protein